MPNVPIYCSILSGKTLNYFNLRIKYIPTLFYERGLEFLSDGPCSLLFRNVVTPKAFQQGDHFAYDPRNQSYTYLALGKIDLESQY